MKIYVGYFALVFLGLSYVALLYEILPAISNFVIIRRETVEVPPTGSTEPGLANTSFPGTIPLGGTADDEDETTSAEPYLNADGKCYVRVLIFDRGKKLALRRSMLKDLVKKKDDSLVTSEVKFSNNCSVEITFSDNFKRFNYADVVIFNMVISAVPPKIPPLGTNLNQTWVFFAWEAPKGKLSRFQLDATWTYHRNSNVQIPYGYHVRGVPLTNQTKSPEQWIEGKTKLVLWIASHCRRTGWPRLNFVNQLKKYVPVDVYGRCGNLTCKPHWAPKCMGDLLKKYKFYLSLESRKCEYYITEKAWEKPLQYGVVPIVYGPSKKDYDNSLPPNSFIHLSEFKSVKELADFLLLLDAKPETYAKYLEWRYNGSIKIPRKMYDSFDPQMFVDVFSIMNERKKGLLKRKYLKDTPYYSCRPQHEMRTGYGVGNWYPW